MCFGTSQNFDVYLRLARLDHVSLNPITGQRWLPFDSSLDSECVYNTAVCSTKTE